MQSQHIHDHLDKLTNHEPKHRHIPCILAPNIGLILAGFGKDGVFAYYGLFRPYGLFNAEVYTARFVSERSFAWIDKFRALLVRCDRKDANFLAGHHLAFALINLRHLFAMKV